MGTPEDGSFIPIGAASKLVLLRAVAQQPVRNRPALMQTLLQSLDDLDPEKAAQFRNDETFKAKSAITNNLGHLRDVAGADEAIQFLRDTLRAIEGGDAA